MIKRVAITIFALGVLMACGTKKRTTYAKKPQTVAQGSQVKMSAPLSQTKTDTDYPMPEDLGEFVKFPIVSVQDYIETFAEIAQFEMKAYGIPASITLAQGILESGAGKSALVQKTNNHFGIKCHKEWGGEFDFHDDDEKGECFRKYNHPMYSFRDHSIFLTTRARYSFLFELRSDDYRGWASGLSKAGYATDKRYPQKLISYIEQYQLDKYDKALVNQGYVTAKQPKDYDYKTHVVQKGDTLYSISRRYFVSIDELMRLNKMKNTGLSIGQQLIVKTEKGK